MTDFAEYKLTKTDTVALWHAVDSYALQVKVMSSMTMPDGSKFTPEQIEAERQRLLQAHRALRKVNAIRKAQSGRSTEKLQEQHKAAGGAGA
ncbi:MAG: hypothetical protein J7556_14815 [Acidovorax sp.]|nr:hypothetical protein [Acidovorax sp.]